MNFEQGLEITASVVFNVYLIWVSWQDFKEMQVVRYSHLLGMVANLLQIVLLIVYRSENWGGEVREYLVAGSMLLILQAAAYFLRLYGLADVFVCFLCGMFFLFEKGPEYYLLAHFMIQAVAGVLLLIVQSIKGNVKGACLRHPVPYIPYLSVAFILTNMVL